MATNSINSLIGKGIRYPFTKSIKGGVELNEGVERINQALFLLLSTPKGSRIMQPEWGCSIDKYKFDPFDDVLLDKLEYALTEDVKKWEPRIIVKDISFLADEDAKDSHILYIRLSYNIINTDIEGNYVYPFRVGTTVTVKSRSYN